MDHDQPAEELSPDDRDDAICDRFVDAWRAGAAPRIEDYLEGVVGRGRAELLGKLLREELELRQRVGEDPSPAEYRRRFPDDALVIDAAFGPPAGDPVDGASSPSSDRPDVADSSTTPPVGARLRYFGDYKLIEELGRGGMGVVYKARQTSLNRLVGLKTIRLAALASEDEQRRFQNEAEMVATLDHPHIVPIYEVGQHDGQRDFSMKLICGTSLDKKQAAYIANPKSAAKLLKQAAEAVHHAHQRGILHRDLKPANILLDEHGEPFVTDFGLAKRFVGDSELTQTGVIVGTPAYMAPEQASGRRGVVTTSSDVYSLGAILYALLTGRAPFGGDSIDETLQHVRESPPTPPSKINPRVPRDMEVICLKCLDKDPRLRYASAQVLADDLGRYLASEPIMARPVTRFRRVVKWARRNPAVATLLGVVVLVTALGLAGVVWAWRDAERALKETNRQYAILALERGQSECDRDHVGRGLLWMVEGLEAAGRAGDEPTEHALRANLAAWQREVHPLKWIASHEGPVTVAVFEPDGTTIRSAAACPRLERPERVSGESGTTDRAPEQADPRPPGHRWEITRRDGATGDLIATSSKELVYTDPLSPGISPNSISPNGRTVLTLVDVPVVQIGPTVNGIPVVGGPNHTILDGRVVATDPKGPVPAGPWASDPDHQGPTVNGIPVVGGPNHTILDGRVVATDPKGPVPAGPWASDPDHQGPRITQIGFWDATSGKPIGEASSLPIRPYAVAFSPDGKKALTALRGPRKGPPRSLLPDHYPRGGEAGEARLWDVDKGQSIGKPISTSGPVSCVAFSPDGRTVLIATEGEQARGGQARLWDASTGAPIGDVLSHDGLVGDVAFSPDGKLVLIGGGRETRLWDVSNGERIRTIGPYPDNVRHVAFSPDGRMVLTVAGRAIWLNETSSGKAVAAMDRGDVINAVAFSPDGRMVLTVAGRAIWLNETSSGKAIAGPMAHGDVVNAVAFSPDGKRVATACRDWTAQVWDAAGGIPIGASLEHRFGVNTVAFSPDGRMVLTGSGDAGAAIGEVRLWELNAELRSSRELPHQESITALAFSPRGTTLVTGTSETARLWDVTSGRPGSDPIPFPEGVSALAFSRDGRSLLVYGGGTIRFWEIAHASFGPDGKAVPYYGFTHASFGPDGKTARLGRTSAGEFTDKQTSTIQIVDVASGNPVGNPIMFPGGEAIAFSPDGKMIVTGGKDGIAQIWDIDSRRPIGRPMRHSGGVCGVAFSPDGQTVATASDGATRDGRGLVQLWGVSTNDPFGKAMVHPHVVNSVAFSPDSRLLVTWGLSDGAWLWDTATYQRIGNPGPQGPLVVLRDIPAPVPARVDVDELRIRIQVLTGMELDAPRNDFRMLDASTWDRRRKSLRPGSPPN